MLMLKLVLMMLLVSAFYCSHCSRILTVCTVKTELYKNECVCVRAMYWFRFSLTPVQSSKIGEQMRGKERERERGREK